jgi:hypothetical protein
MRPRSPRWCRRSHPHRAPGKSLNARLARREMQVHSTKNGSTTQICVLPGARVLNPLVDTMKRTLNAATLILASLPAPASSAQQANPSGPEQKKEKLQGISTVVIVTGSKTDEAQQDVTQKVNLVFGDQIAALAASARNVTELIQYQPGVSVTVLSRNDANWGSYGGLGSKYNSYLLDGLPIDSFVDTMSLDPWVFERMETHQGPASVMYSNYLSADFAGTQAPLTGITNLILKERIDSPETSALIAGGSWGTFAARLHHQDHKGNLHYFMGVTYERLDYTDYGAPKSWLGMLDDPSYRKMKFYGKASYGCHVARRRRSGPDCPRSVASRLRGGSPALDELALGKRRQARSDLPGLFGIAGMPGFGAVPVAVERTRSFPIDRPEEAAPACDTVTGRPGARNKAPYFSCPLLLRPAPRRSSFATEPELLPVHLRAARGAVRDCQGV